MRKRQALAALCAAVAEGTGGGTDVLTTVVTPLQVKVRITKGQWERIVEHKHPIMQGKEALVRETLQRPSQVRRSRRDPAVHLYYREEKGTPYRIVVVVKHLNGDGFVMTAYRTDRIKEGDIVWTP